MKQILIVSAIFFLVFGCTDQEHNHDSVIIAKTQEGQVDSTTKSLKAHVQNKIGSAQFRIDYHSPAVRGRVIWGGLVPYDRVWVTGAHTATSIECDKNLVIDSKTIPAGKYAFFTIPGKEAWTVIINKNWDQHLADEYEPADDLLRMKIRPDTMDYHQERLMYDIGQLSQKEGNIVVMWEKLKLTIPVRIAD